MARRRTRRPVRRPESLIGSAVANETSGEVGVVVAETAYALLVQTTPGRSATWYRASVVEV